MTAFASLTLVNNAAANVTFIPTGIDPKGVATWMTNDAVYDSRRKVTMSVSLPSNSGSVIRVKQKVTVPVMDAIDTTKKVGEAYVYIESVFPKLASQTTRLDLRKFADTLLTNAVSTAAFTDFENIY